MTGQSMDCGSIIYLKLRADESVISKAVSRYREIETGLLVIPHTG
jgi:hypothetical protein